MSTSPLTNENLPFSSTGVNYESFLTEAKFGFLVGPLGLLSTNH